ncbi:unnamed protein product [Mytilus coruscus]|uniref:Fibronectin type-III domain-containing protein n=1 Tax=Mytilus coruscus TaxID=42192 RepID=A0A6J8EEI5_MYTCO|nr:unnamed protein product [Mytilus coruscus]
MDAIPSSPKLKFVNRTSATISLDIINPAGHVDYYCLYLKRHQKQFIILFTNDVQRYIVRNLFTAEEYSIYGVAVSNAVISSPSLALNISTEYSSFNITLLGRSTNRITLGLTGIRRTTLSYSIYLNGIPWKHRIDTHIQNESISDLLPGTLYIVKVSVDFGKFTKDTVLKVVTYPETPGPMTVIQSKYTMRLRLKILSGNIDYYRVLSTSVCTSPTFMNVSYEVEKASDSKNEIILITEPGACCSLDVAAVSNNISGEVQTYAVKRRETVPGLIIQSSIKINGMSVTISWSMPNQPNGIIVEYTMQFWSSTSSIKNIRFICTNCRGSTECDHQEKQKSLNVNATTTVNFMGDRNRYNRTFQREQTTFNVTVRRLPENSDFYYTIYASTRQGNGSMYTASFKLKSDLVSSQNQDKGVIAGAVTGTFVCTIAVMLIVCFICKQYRNKLRGL